MIYQRCTCAYCTDRVEEQVGLKARRIALVAQAHGLEVPILDEGALVRAAMAG